MSLVFDASALVAQAKRERGTTLVSRLLADTSQVRLAHAINLCEVHYHLLNVGGDRRADRAMHRWEQVGLESRDGLDPAFWRAVARLNVEFQHASLADCFVIALAQRIGGTIVTADHPGFEPVAARSLCPVVFIR